ncbi:MAG: YdcF family protein [Gemmatimonadaceae bacterium]
MRIFKRPVLSVRVIASSFALSILATLLIVQLGAVEILGLHSLGYLISTVAVIGVALSVFGAAEVLIAFDGVLIATYLILAFTPVMARPAANWVRNDPRPAQPLDAVIVLSGWVKPDSALEAVAVERLLTGLELVKAGLAPRLITTRVISVEGGIRVVSDDDQRRFIRLAGLESAWTEVDSVGTTHDEAERSAAFLFPFGAKRVAVVTSPMHTRRACAVFEGVGFEVTCVAAREMVAVTRHPVTPDDRLAAFREYFYERLGMVKYRAKGWIK